MPSFEERFAAFGRAIDSAIDRARSAQQVKPYRPRPRRTVRDRWRDWRLGAGEKASAAAESVADWKRGLDSEGSRRFNLALIGAAMVVTALATWMWTRTYSTGLSAREIEALSKLNRGTPGAIPPSPSGGAWWNQAALPTAAPSSPPGK